MTMDCATVRRQLLDYQRARLDADAAADVRSHLADCAACSHENAAEATLTDVLEQRLPEHRASLALKQKLAREYAPGAFDGQPSWFARWRGSLVPALALAAVVVVVFALSQQRATIDGLRGPDAMIGEAVNDHVRVLISEHPLDVQAGGMHQVKPWFAGHLDFAPVVGDPGADGEFVLHGGAVGYFVDRRAAIYVYSARLHRISLMVFRADGFAWPTRGLTKVGSVDAYESTARGFNVLLWRHGELGYALVSDVNRDDLTKLATRLAAGS